MNFSWRVAFYQIVLCIILNVATTSSRQPKNILFLVSDDMRPALGCYKGARPGFHCPPMHTPNLDSLAETSVLFEKAYVQQSLCSPSRTSFLTSRRPDTTRILDLNSYFRTYGGNFTTIPQFFKEMGYASIDVGKIFHPGPDASGRDDQPYSWTETPYHAKWNYHNEESWKALTAEELKEKPLQDAVEIEHAVNKLRELAKDFEENAQPFFLAIGAQKPHLPFVFPEEFLSYYPSDKIKVPSNPFIPIGMPDMAWSNFGELRSYTDASGEAVGVPDLGMANVTYPEYKIKELRRAYYAAVSFVDFNMGKILNELKDLNLENDTIVVFLGDHGWQLGEHSEWCKLTNFEVANHAPLMIRVPGLTDNGIRTSKLAEFVDIFPTLVEAAGFQSLDTCSLDSNNEILCIEGSSLLPLMKNPDYAPWKESVFWQYPRGGNQKPHIPKCMGYSIRTEFYHYNEWVQIIAHNDGSYEPNWDESCDRAELYDLDIDPKENTNVLDFPDYEEVKFELMKKLRDGWRSEICL